MLDGDENYLAKAVSWVYKYTRSWGIDRDAEAEAEAEADVEAPSQAEDPVPPAQMKEKTPALVVFDLDFSVWPFDCHKDRHMPFAVAGQKIVDAWGRDASPYPDVPGIITELVEREIPVAYASRNQSVDQLEALLRAIAIAPKNRPDIKNLWDVLPSRDYIQAYSSGLSRAKTKHFTALQRVTGVPFSKMLFFDDDQANITTAAAQGVIAMNVKGSGVTRPIFERAMKIYQTY
jgi:magnesium-dependent phosphatase 1